MKRNGWILCLLLLFFLPVLGFSAVRVAVGIPLGRGPHGPYIYVGTADVPAGVPWPSVSLTGTLIGASEDHLLVRTPEGLQYPVYLTPEALIHQPLQYGAYVSLRGRSVNSALYADEIQVMSYGDTLALSPPRSYVSNGGFALGAPAYPPQFSVPFSGSLQVFHGKLVQMTPQFIVVQLDDGSQRSIFLTGQTGIYGALDAGGTVTVNAYESNGSLYAQSVSLVYHSDDYYNSMTEKFFVR